MEAGTRWVQNGVDRETPGHIGSERSGSGQTGTHRFRTERIERNWDTPVQNGVDREKQGHTGSELSGSGETGTHRFRTEWIGRHRDTPVYMYLNM